MVTRIRPSQWSIPLATLAVVAFISPCAFAGHPLIPETQDRLNLRYGDRPLVQRVLAMEPEKALELYAEVLTYLEAKYVDDVKFDQLLARGVENLDQALHNPAFLEAVAPKGVNAARLAKYREVFRGRWNNLNADTKAAAVQQLFLISLDFQASLLLPKNHRNLVVIEFVFAACESLDPYSSYLSPESYRLHQLLAQADIAGIGVDLGRTQPKQPLVVSYVFPGGPADHADIKVGDVLLSIGDTPTTQLSAIEAQLLLHGPEGSRVAVEIKDAVTGKVYRLAIARLNPDLPSIGRHEMIDPEAGIGYIHLQVFNSTALADLDKALQELRQQGMRGLILDLRGNPGGSFAAAIQVADRFLSKGVIVATQGKAHGASNIYQAENDGDCVTPLVVLVDHETASAAEIVAGALKDHNRAILVGQKTYGKGSVQGVFALKTLDSALRITTARFLTPSGTSLAGAGISPDIVVGADPANPMAAGAQEAQNKTAIEQIRRQLGFGMPMR